MTPKPPPRFQAPITVPGARLLRHIHLRFLSRLRSRGSREGSSELPLVPLVDVLLGIVLFLLASFHASGDCCIVRQLEVPKADHVREMVDAPIVEVTENLILVDGVPAGTTRDASIGGPPRRMDEVFNIMKNKRDLWKQINPGREFFGASILKIDRDVPMAVVKSLMQTVAMAGYPSVSFMVARRG
jgi:biopolymer transport protein ExbD